MRVTEVRYQRVKNLGNYETERAEVVIELNEGDKHTIALIEARNEVETFLGLNEPEPYPGCSPDRVCVHGVPEGSFCGHCKMVVNFPGEY